MDFSFNVSMTVSGSDEDEFVDTASTSSTRKHIVYQSCLLELFAKVSAKCDAVPVVLVHKDLHDCCYI